MEKTKKYLEVIVKPKNGNDFVNPLLLSEAHLIAGMAKENRELVVTCKEVPLSTWKALFVY